MTKTRLGTRLCAGALAILIPLGIAGAAAADEDCGNFNTQSEMNDCAAKNYRAADAALGSIYKKVVARLKDDPDGLKLLKDAERAWIAFRDAECSFASSGVEGGSIQPMIEAECFQAQTEARTAMLKTYLACEEGDLSCPLPPE